MNIKKSGKAPDRIKAALLAAMLITLTGCNGGTSSAMQTSSVQTSSEAPPGGETSESSSSSSTEDTHVPDTSDASDPPDNSSDVSDSSENSESSSDSEPQTSETSEPNSETSEQSSEPVSSDTPSSSEPPESSSEQSTSSVEPPPPPPEIIIPDVKVPTSPGTQLITGAHGVIDFSNASQGYVSAKYTGSSSKVKFRIEANGSKGDPDLDPNGAVEYYALTFGSGTYTVTIFEQIPGSINYAVAAQGSFDVQLDSSLSPFLYPNRYVNYGQNSDIVYKAAELCAGKTSTIDKIAAIFTWVSQNVSYDYDLAATVKSGYVPDPDRTLSRRTGICFDYSALMAAMLRSQSIPTRLVIGDASPNIYHAWNEVYTEETGWITPELLLRNSGYNLVDATFYSSSANKQQIADYISNGANYIADKYY